MHGGTRRAGRTQSGSGITKNKRQKTTRTRTRTRIHDYVCLQPVGDGNGPLGCSWYAKSGLYVFLNRSGRCAATCDADVMWSQKDKRLTEAWIAASATVCLISVVAAILALLKPDKQRVASSVGENSETLTSPNSQPPCRSNLNLHIFFFFFQNAL